MRGKHPAKRSTLEMVGASIAALGGFVPAVQNVNAADYEFRLTRRRRVCFSTACGNRPFEGPDPVSKCDAKYGSGKRRRRRNRGKRKELLHA